jgi:hypothetical protein
LGAAIGAGVGYLWRDLVFGLLVGIAFGAAWTLLLALHTRGHTRDRRAPQVASRGAESSKDEAQNDGA